ncbi:MAG: YecA family protein [Endozoicomonas sp. (ex Botrylloides leachii)]|nr:YecA family protein [Endozoicomonas sp. (ex Botrylloides leachii)]
MLSIRAKLEQLIATHAAIENSMSFHCIHGYLTALAICPVDLPRSEIINSIFGEMPMLSSAEKQNINAVLDNLKNEIDRSFNEEGGFTLSCELPFDEDDDDGNKALEDWCGGFMEAHFLTENAWFQKHEQEVCELLLPIMLASGLFDEEPEFKDMLNDEQLTDEMYSQIPEVLMELYLMFTLPEDIRTKDKRVNFDKKK